MDRFKLLVTEADSQEPVVEHIVPNYRAAGFLLAETVVLTSAAYEFVGQNRIVAGLIFGIGQTAIALAARFTNGRKENQD